MKIPDSAHPNVTFSEAESKGVGGGNINPPACDCGRGYDADTLAFVWEAGRAEGAMSVLLRVIELFHKRHGDLYGRKSRTAILNMYYWLTNCRDNLRHWHCGRLLDEDTRQVIDALTAGGNAKVALPRLLEAARGGAGR